MALCSVYGPINGALFPYMTKSRNLHLIKNVIICGSFINIIFLFLFHILFPYICPLVFDNFSEQSMSVLNILIISCLVGLPSTFLGYPFLAAFGHPNYTNYSLIITSLLHLFGLFLLYSLGLINIQNVAIMVLLSDTFLLLVRIIGVHRYKLWQLSL